MPTDEKSKKQFDERFEKEVFKLIDEHSVPEEY